ncbi:MAG: hypothetical protein HY722_10650 [Planctomycetes bacterium]|nr:hypothetical protein [Planctomycetota bacterium]
MVLVHTLGHLSPGVLAVNYILSRCVDVGPEVFLTSPLSGNPMSCPKVRKRIPQVTSRVDCSCTFPFAPDRYPTPPLHLLTLHPEARVPVGPARPDPSAENAARRYALLLRRVDELRREVEEARGALLGILRAAPDRSLACEGGRYVLRESLGVEAIAWEPAQVEGAPAPVEVAPEGGL